MKYVSGNLTTTDSATLNHNPEIRTRNMFIRI